MEGRDIGTVVFLRAELESSGSSRRSSVRAERRWMEDIGEEVAAVEEVLAEVREFFNECDQVKNLVRLDVLPMRCWSMIPRSCRRNRAPHRFPCSPTAKVKSSNRWLASGAPEAVTPVLVGGRSLVRSQMNMLIPVPQMFVFFSVSSIAMPLLTLGQSSM